MESGKHSSSSSSLKAVEKSDHLQLPPTNTSLEIISNQELFKRSGEYLVIYLFGGEHYGKG